MSLLDKYARQPVTEKRTNPVASRLEKSLYDDFVEHCQQRGLTTSEAIRYLIIELLQNNEQTKVNQGKHSVTSNKRKLSKGEQEIAATNTLLSHGNLSLTDDNEVLANVDLRKKKKTRKNMQMWTVNHRLPCPVCKEWVNKKNYHRDHGRKHGFTDGYELIHAHLELVNQMVQEENDVEQMTKQDKTYDNER